MAGTFSTALRRQYPDVLAEPRAVARLLCGVGSPKLTAAGLVGKGLFGALGQVPFQTVLSRVSGEA